MKILSIGTNTQAISITNESSIRISVHSHTCIHAVAHVHTLSLSEFYVLKNMCAKNFYLCAKKQNLFCRFGHGCFLHALEGVYQVCLTCENGLTLFLLGDVKQKYLKRNEKCLCVRVVLRFFRFNCRT